MGASSALPGLLVCKRRGLVGRIVLAWWWVRVKLGNFSGDFFNVPMTVLG